ncbi:MAG: DUF2807 domain-containing protein, partial [Bacteroidetes bacterium]|nr:DUF2807 domain-containing protein [Bacteroidota bacterium]
DKLKIAGPVDIHIVQGTTESVKVMAPPEVINRVLVEVDGGVLKIRNKHDNWGQGEDSWYGDKSVWQKKHYRITAYVTVVALKSITISGSGSAKFGEGVKADHFSLTLRGSGSAEGKIEARSLVTIISGSGNVKLTGTAGTSRLKVSGSGVFTATDLITSNSNVHVSGSGDARVNASESLTAGVSGSGNVNYTGTAKSITRTTSGSGSISRF